MIWLFLLLAVASFALALYSTSVALSVVCLLAALVFVVLFVMGLLAQRVGSQSRSDSMILDPTELQRLREQAQARRAASGMSEPPAA